MQRQQQAAGRGRFIPLFRLGIRLLGERLLVIGQTNSRTHHSPGLYCYEDANRNCCCREHQYTHRCSRANGDTSGRGNGCGRRAAGRPKRHHGYRG